MVHREVLPLGSRKWVTVRACIYDLTPSLARSARRLYTSSAVGVHV
jgi:hypothetical protein